MSEKGRLAQCDTAPPPYSEAEVPGTSTGVISDPDDTAPPQDGTGGNTGRWTNDILSVFGSGRSLLAFCVAFVLPLVLEWRVARKGGKAPRKEAGWFLVIGVMSWVMVVALVLSVSMLDNATTSEPLLVRHCYIERYQSCLKHRPKCEDRYSCEVTLKGSEYSGCHCTAERKSSGRPYWIVSQWRPCDPWDCINCDTIGSERVLAFVLVMACVWVTAFLFTARLFLVARLRHQTRAEFAIRGSALEDTCLTLFCNPCLLAQMALEQDIRHPLRE